MRPERLTEIILQLSAVGVGCESILSFYLFWGTIDASSWKCIVVIRMCDSSHPRVPARVAMKVR